MPGLGPSDGRRPRLSRTQRFINAVSWPNPAGMLLSLAGAMVVVSGAIGVGAGFPTQGTTAAPQQRAPGTSAPGTSAPGTAAVSSATSTGSPRSASTNAPKPVPASSSTPFKAISAIQAQAVKNAGDPSSIFVLANKRNPLKPLDFAPSDLVSPSVASGSDEPAALRKEVALAVEKMFAAAAAAGVQINIQSSYRSYATQEQLYGSYVSQKGRAAAETTSARPGYSEHQSGLALDIGDSSVPASCEFTECVATTPAGLWVAAHGVEFGFIVRYPDGKESTTGYAYEPWHLRYVGVAAAEDMKAHGFLTYEQYLGKAAAPGY